MACMAKPGPKLPPDWVLTVASEIMREERLNVHQKAHRLAKTAQFMQDLAPELELWQPAAPSPNTLRDWARRGRAIREEHAWNDELFQQAMGAA